MRLVYVSALVFGDAASFLLPWKRVLKVTDAQVGISSFVEHVILHTFLAPASNLVI